MARTIREWTCEYASASEAGDYVQILFEETPDSDARYVLIQSQFEFPQACDVTVETDGGDWYANLTVERAKLDRQRLVIDGRADTESVRMIVNFEADDATFADLKRVLLIIVPVVELQ